MPPVYSEIVSDVDAGRVAGDRRVGGVLVSMYRLTVSLWRPNSRAILRMDIPSSLAFCTASHLACCRNVDLLGEVVTVIKFLIFNTKNLELKTYYDVARLYPEHQSINVEFSREEIADGIPAKRWLVVTI